MGCQGQMSSDRARTNWTMSMEHYFIDLMLDQVHMGNRMGHTFNKQAWHDMLAMFNSNFGLIYDVNVLKSGYTTLWKQYNDIRNLLDQNDFTWDSARRMVIADTYVWDACIKAHPDLQFYRNKTLMNFNDLCLIYAHTTADGRYSLSSHDIDFYEDVQGIGVGVNSQPLVEEDSRTDWTLAMDQYFVKLMLDHLMEDNKINSTFNQQSWKDMITLFNKEFGCQQGKGFLNDRYKKLLINSTFNQQSWKDMITVFNEKFGCQQGKGFLKDRYKKLLKYYTDIRSLLEVKGFSWDDRRCMIVGDDLIWDRYVKEHPRAHVYRKRTLLNFRDLSFIYENKISNGNSMQCERDFEDEIALERTGDDYSQFHANGDCSSTHWTPLMDRYFIDLMLDKVCKQKTANFSFSHIAWMEVVASFKERFGVQYDNDYFRTRYKHFEKQFNYIKNLLNRRQIVSTETQHLITSNDVWDVYYEEHSRLTSRRDNSKPNYNDLFLIYGNSTSHEGHDRFGQTATSIANGTRSISRYHSRSDWTPQMDRFFIDLMVKQVRIESMVDGKFNKLAWKDMVLRFSLEFGSQYNKDVLKSRFMNLRKRFNDMKTILDQSCFFWDEIQQMITGDEILWDAYVQEHPDARSYRSRTLPNFNDLFLIFGKDNSVKRQLFSTCSDKDDLCFL